MDIGRLTEFLAHVVPGFDGLETCDRLTGGASRETYRIVAQADGSQLTYALRRALGEDDASFLGQGPGLASEPVLFRAARAAGVPGPEVVGVLGPGDGLGDGFLMEWVEGETLGGRIARSAAFEGARGNLARQSGEALARIHGIDVDAAGLKSHLAVVPPSDLIIRTHEGYQRLGAPYPMIDFTARWLLANLPSERPLALTHGDFRNGNLIVSPETGLRAVLDWELCHIGDPMRDLGWLCTRSWRFGGSAPVGGFGTCEDLFAGYETISGETVDRDAVRFWEVFGSWWWSIGCLAMAQSWREDPEVGVERPMIGRRSSECQIDCVNMIIPGPARPPEERRARPGEAGLPDAQELVESVTRYFGELQDRLPERRDRFLARVAQNALAIVEREQQFGASRDKREAEALANLLGKKGELGALRRELCDGLWSGEIGLENEKLHTALRESVLVQVLIDQPDYPGANEALAAR